MVKTKLQFERDTKRMYRYREIGGTVFGIAGVLYVSKEAIGEKPPTFIEVSVEAVEG